MPQSSSPSIRSRRTGRFEDNSATALGPGSRSFFERSPAGNAARAIYLKTFLPGNVLMVLMVFTILPIFWASLYKIPARNLQGWVVVRVDLVSTLAPD